MDKLYISKKYYKYIYNIRLINNSDKSYYELLLEKDLCDDIIRESNPSKCVECNINYNDYYRYICLYYKCLLESKLNITITEKIKKKIKIIDNIIEEEFNMGNTMIYYDHICSNCIKNIIKYKNNKYKIIK